MASREKNTDSLDRNLQLLRSITHSESRSKKSIVSNASDYIRQLKQKVERLNEEVASASSSSSSTSSSQSSNPRVTVESVEKGFLVKVESGKSCPGLLVWILESFEELGLSVVEARVRCVDSFSLQALGGEDDEEEVDEEIVRWAMTNAIKNW
ncbi:hypothetical protein M569_05356, partial [Genlisea aurea]